MSADELKNEHIIHCASEEASQAIPLLKMGSGTWFLRHSGTSAGIGPSIYMASARLVPQALSPAYLSNLEHSSAINLTPLVVISSPHYQLLSTINNTIFYYLVSVTRRLCPDCFTLTMPFSRSSRSSTDRAGSISSRESYKKATLSSKADPNQALTEAQPSTLPCCCLCCIYTNRREQSTKLYPVAPPCSPSDRCSTATKTETSSVRLSWLHYIRIINANEIQLIPTGPIPHGPVSSDR
jgi:hypothetical protein